MATLAERFAKLGAKIAPWLGWIIANRPTWSTFQHAYDGHEDFRNSVNTDTEIADWPAGELEEGLAQSFPTGTND